MNVTFLIGNGFDINLGLATQYADFIEIYRNISQQDSPTIQRFKREIINPNISLWSNAEMAFGQQTAVIFNDFTTEDYCDCHEHFCTELARYLKNEQERFVINENNATTIAEKFSMAVNSLTDGFRRVQQEQIQSLLFEHNSELLFHFLDFNYTNTLDLLCVYTNNLIGWKQHKHYKNAMGQLIHIHGSIEKSMVLGVHDESQIANVDGFKSYDSSYLAQLIKSQTDLINEEKTYQQAEQVLNSSHLIYVYGMSLGETDKLWWGKICQLLINNRNLRIIIHCHGFPQNELFRGSIKRFANNQKERFFELGSLDEDVRKSLYDRVHITGANIFKDLSNSVVSKIDEAIAS